jgi:succinate dehydrogenase / fumarate reductase flavoprotein subunit
MVSRSILTEIRGGRGIDGNDYVHLDLRHVSREIIEERLPEISTFCKIYMGIDPSEKPIPVLPTAHYAMGGIPTDIDGRVLRDAKGTVVDGLFSAGECACVSVHGANRLGCNSLLDTVVFGRRAGIAMGDYLINADKGNVSPLMINKAMNEINVLRNKKGKEKTGAIRNELQTAMMDDCSVFRNEKDLSSLINTINNLEEKAADLGINDKGTIFNTELLEAIELYHLINLAKVISSSALQRQESRGGHFREDFPVRDDKNWLKHTFATKSKNSIEFSYKPVAITRFQPAERKY